MITWVLGKLFWPMLLTSSMTYCAFRLGPTGLPAASRKAGRFIGMQYNYLKLTISYFSPPADQANRLISEYRRGTQQGHAFTREVRQSLLK